MTSFSLSTSFGFFNIQTDSDRVGLTGLNRKIAGGVTSLTISARAEFKTGESNLISEALNAWDLGELTALSEIPVIYPTSEFREQVSIAMRQIKPGETLSYQQLAQAAGHPAAVRAAASVCARNPIPIIIPCHRIIKSDGKIGNYFYGAEVKDALLRHENAF